MKSNFIKNTLKTIIISIIMILIGFISIFLVHLMPTDNMKSNVKKSIESESPTNWTPQLTNYDNTKLEDFIDEVMIDTSIYDKHSPLLRSINNYYFYINYQPYTGLKNYLNGKNINEIEYARYWHGYTVFLKIFLNFFYLSDIKMLNYCFQILLIISICLLMYKKKLNNYIFLLYFL